MSLEERIEKLEKEMAELKKIVSAQPTPERLEAELKKRGIKL